MDSHASEFDCGCRHPESRQHALFPARDYISGESFEIRKCGVCGLTITWPRPADVGPYYPAGYYGEGKRYPAPLQRFLDGLYAARARRLEAASTRRPGRALDIGCGQGLLLAQLRRRGWEVTGTELSERSAHFARNVLGLDVRVGDVTTLNLPSESFDLVILWHVLEHVPNPLALLREAARLLRPGGTLLVAVPNFGSPEAQFGHAAWFHLDVPRHLNHFDLPVLKSLLEDAGLDIVKTGYFSPEYDVFSAVQTVLNRLGMRPNLLYNLLRSGGARPLSAVKSSGAAGEYVATLLMAPLLGALSLIWVPLAAMTGQGATLTVYARMRREQ